MSSLREAGSPLRAVSLRAPALLLALAAACARSADPPPAEPSPPPRDAGELLAGNLYRGEIRGRAIDRYRVELAQGAALLLEVGQDEVDLVVKVAGPGEREPLVFDHPPATTAPERVCFVARRAGAFIIDVLPFDGAGDYSLRVVDQRPSTPSDRLCARAAATLASARRAEDLERRIELTILAGEQWEEAGESLLAAIAWRESGQLRVDRGESQGGLADLERAFALARAAEQPRLEVSILNCLGLTRRDAGHLSLAADVLDRALALAEEISDERGRAAALTNRGLLDEEMGDPHRAVDRYREALEIWRRENEPGEVAQTLDNLGNVLGILDHHDEALDRLDEALHAARAAGERDREATVLASIGWIHRLRGEPAEALVPLREARAIRRAIGDARNEAGVLDRLGTVLSLSGDTDAAEAAYRSSLEISDRMDLPAFQAATRNNLGCLLAETDRRREAADVLRQALAYYRVSDDPKSWAHSEYCLARLEHHDGDLGRALEHIRRSLGIVEDLRQRARAAGHHYSPIWLWQDYAELEVELLLDRYRAAHDPRDLAEAFAAADQLRARTLYEVVVSTRGGAERVAGRVLESRLDDLQKRLSALATQRSALASSTPERAVPTELDAEIRQLRLAIQFTRAEQRAAARNAGRLGMPRPLSVEEAQSLLDSRTAFLTYILGTERSHLLVLTRDSLRPFELEPRRNLEAHAEGLYHALELSRRPGGQWLLSASALGALLLPSGAIPGNIDRLMIAPEGMLHYVPFGALGSPRKGPDDGRAARLVIDDFEVVTVPSAAVLAALRTRRLGRSPAVKTVAVFADPVFSASDLQRNAMAFDGSAAQDHGSGSVPPRPTPVSRTIVADRLPTGPPPRLPATAREAASILARVGAGESLALLGPDATKQAVLEIDLRPYRILHFATHAWIDERFPELSGLVLSTVDHAGREIDGSLYLHEIDRLELGADLTVLSGCQTALGRRVRGDGLLGLTQGFLHAGSSQVLVSLWSLDDDSAALLMDRFYGRMLEGGETPAAALRHAQLWLRRQGRYEAPRHWAPFVLQGDG